MTLKNEIIWQPIKQRKANYILQYYPARIDACPMATLSLTFLEAVTSSQVAEVLDEEFKMWAKSYPVPLLASAFDNTGIFIDKVKGSDQLHGYFDPISENFVYGWNLIKEDQIPKHLISKDHIKKCYANLDFKTSEEIRNKANEETKKIRHGLKIIRRAMFFWLLLVPIILYLMEENSQWIGFIALAYTLWKAWREYGKITGRRKKTLKELEDEEVKRKKDHYYYHCERNPDGFLKLKCENFEREAKEQIRKEARELEGN